MSTPNSRIANVLLGAAKDADLIRLLFDRADQVNRNVGSLISEATAMKHYKGSLAKVLSIARDAGTQASVLAKFTKDSRVSVRQAILENPNTPYDSIVSIIPWVMERRESAEVNLLLDRLNPDDVVRALELVPQNNRNAAGDSRYWSWISAEVVLRKLENADKELFLRAASLGFPAITGSLALVAHLREIGVSLTEVIAVTLPALQGPVVGHVTSAGSVLTNELAEFVVKLEPPVTGVKPTLIEEGSLEKLATVNRPDILAYALRGGLTGPALSKAILHADASRLNEIVDKDNAMIKGRLTAEQELEIVKRFLAIRAEDILVSIDVVSLLKILSRPLPRDLAMKFIRFGSAELTAEWLTNSHAERPNRGEVLALFKEPHRAFASKYSIEPLVFFRQRLAASSNTDWEDDAAELLDHSLGSLATSYDSVELALSRITKVIGTDAETWDTLLGLANDWGQGLAALISASTALTGYVHVPAVESTEIVQQSLFV